MGTKRSLAPVVRELFEELRPQGKTLDLFAGMGSVTRELRHVCPVVVNDVQGFVSAFSRTRFTASRRFDPDVAAREIYRLYEPTLRSLRREFGRRLALEQAAVSEGSVALGKYMSTAPHRGNSCRVMRRAEAAASLQEASDFVMTTLYFSGSYFSTSQALALDALRFAIEALGPGSRHDWLLSCWLATAGRLVNAPGHTAQFLKPTNEASYDRIARQWRRPTWPTFRDSLSSVRPVGSEQWRSQNRVSTAEAGELVNDGRRLRGVTAAYADPPYTKDHYSRFYHLYETLFRYDFPDSIGVGRYRTTRLPSRFSLATEVVPAFRDLVASLSGRGVPLVLSYPSDGLVKQVGVELNELIEEEMVIKRQIRISTTHSTMGAHRGGSSKSKEENLYVCIPK